MRGSRLEGGRVPAGDRDEGAGGGAGSASGGRGELETSCLEYRLDAAFFSALAAALAATAAAQGQRQKAQRVREQLGQAVKAHGGRGARWRGTKSRRGRRRFGLEGGRHHLCQKGVRHRLCLKEGGRRWGRGEPQKGGGQQGEQQQQLKWQDEGWLVENQNRKLKYDLLDLNFYMILKSYV